MTGSCHHRFAEIVRLVSEQLQSKGKVEMKLVNLLELEIIVTENGRSKRADFARNAATSIAALI